MTWATSARLGKTLPGRSYALVPTIGKPSRSQMPPLPPSYLPNALSCLSTLQFLVRLHFVLK